MLFPPEHVDEEPMIIERIRRGERVESFETVRRRKDGTDIPVSLTISPVRDSIGRIVGASKIARDITAAKESEQRIRMLMREVNHRVKNDYAVILSMIRETNNRSESPDIFEKRVRERIMALSRSHDLLVSADWKGATVADLILDQAKLFGREDAIALHGLPLVLTPNAVQYLGIAFHELCTNSAKYGVLSGHRGSISRSNMTKRQARGAPPVAEIMQVSGHFGCGFLSDDPIGLSRPALRSLTASANARPALRTSSCTSSLASSSSWLVAYGFQYPM